MTVVALHGGGSAEASPVRARRVADGPAATAAAEVDRDARFPVEALEALRAEGLLSMHAPVEVGGAGAGLGEVAEVARALGSSCASTAMIFAMHQIQVACLARHGRSPALRAALADVAAGESLLASATTETGVGGDVRTSLCAVHVDEHGAHLAKQAPVISYGAQADAVLVTARRSFDSPPSDQVLVFCPRAELQLEPVSGWDALGFRGTCSGGFSLQWDGPPTHVLDDPYGDISAETMLPVSHVLWASVWLGLAEGAAEKARQYARGAARGGSSGPSTTRLAELAAALHRFRALVGHTVRHVEAVDDRSDLTTHAAAAELNLLKVSASEAVVEVVTAALRICGMAGYRLDSPYSLGRALRDAHGAALMVGNDRILTATGQMLLGTHQL